MHNGNWFSKNLMHYFEVLHQRVGHALGSFLTSICNSSWAFLKSLDIFQLWAIVFCSFFTLTTAFCSSEFCKALFTPIFMLCPKQGICCMFNAEIAFKIFEPFSVVQQLISYMFISQSNNCSFNTSFILSDVWFTSKCGQLRQGDFKFQFLST